MQYVLRESDEGVVYVRAVPDTALVAIGKGAKLYKSWAEVQEEYPDAEEPVDE